MSEGNGVVAHVEEPVEQVSEVRKLSKIDIKRIQAREERRRRLINNGVPADKVDAVMTAEDYKNLPVEQKLERFEKLMSQAMQGLQRDILALRHNDGVIADAMDINLKAMARGLTKAGVSLEQQNDIIREVEQELREEHAKQTAAQAEAHKLATEKAEMDRMKSVEKERTTTDDSESAPVPDGATVFEG